MSTLTLISINIPQRMFLNAVTVTAEWDKAEGYRVRVIRDSLPDFPEHVLHSRSGYASNAAAVNAAFRKARGILRDRHEFKG